MLRGAAYRFYKLARLVGLVEKIFCTGLQVSFSVDRVRVVAEDYRGNVWRSMALKPSIDTTRALMKSDSSAIKIFSVNFSEPLRNCADI